MNILNGVNGKVRLAVISTHPIQYYAPWFRCITSEPNIECKVFYLWDFGVTEKIDRGFQQVFKWDISLLEGYTYEMVPNRSRNPGTHHFWGLYNPSLLERIRSYNPDAILMLGYNYASLYEFLARWDRKKAPIFLRGDSHRLVAKPGATESLRRKIIATIFKRFAAFLYVGKANYEYFRYHHVAPGKLFFSPHAVDNARFLEEAENAIKAAHTWKKELGIPHDHTVILFAGKFESKKRPLDLLEAFKKSHLDRTSLLFVGSGNLDSELRRRALDHHNIHFAPFQNQSMMPRTYGIADLFVLPSFGPAETWGLAINEAMCMSCAVVASTHVGCSQDLVHPQVNGLIFEAGNIQALTNTLKDACADYPRLKLWGQRSRKIIKDYNYGRATQGLITALNRLSIKL